MRPAQAVNVGGNGEARIAFDREETWFKGYEMRSNMREKHGDGGHPWPEPLRQIRVKAAALLGVKPPTNEANSKTASEPTGRPK